MHIQLNCPLSDIAEVSPFDRWEKSVRFDIHQHDTFDERTTHVECVWNVH